MPLNCTVESPSLWLNREWLQPEGLIAHPELFFAPDFTPADMPEKQAARFPRTARLLRHADFERVYKQGRRHFSATMTVFYWPRPQSDSQIMAGLEPATRTRVCAPHVPASGLRVGFTVGRALGGAVQRNRMKRRLREAVRVTRPVATIAADVVINPKKSLLAADFEDVKKEVSRAFTVIQQKLAAKPAQLL